jgi:hypothetical protein
MTSRKAIVPRLLLWDTWPLLLIAFELVGMPETAFGLFAQFLRGVRIGRHFILVPWQL